MPRRRSSLEELARVIRLAQPNTRSLSRYLEETWEHVATLLGVEPEALRELVGKPDEEIAPELEALLDQRYEVQAARRGERAAALAASAAERLDRTAVWRDDRVYVDPYILFGALLADVSLKYITFYVARGSTIRTPRHFLCQAAEALGHHDDLVVWIDGDGIHFRWKDGHGGLNLRSQSVSAKEVAFMLHVYLNPPAMRSARSRRPVSIGDEVVSMALFT